MVLSFSDLKKREVINIVDGMSFGKPIDIRIEFPRGIMKGIAVRGAKGKGIFGIFCHSQIFIEDRNIVKIGGDVILVNTGGRRGCPPNNGCGCNKPPKSLPCPPPKNMVDDIGFDDDDGFRD